MLYFDTSFMAPLILEEATSQAVEQFVAALPVGTLAISHWTQLEFSSLLAREVRSSGLPARAARAVSAQFDLITTESFQLLLPTGADYDLARRYLAQHETGLRGGDALHLAIAANHRADMFYSLDKKLLKAGNLLGLPVSTGIHAD